MLIYKYLTPIEVFKQFRWKMALFVEDDPVHGVKANWWRTATSSTWWTCFFLYIDNNNPNELVLIICSSRMCQSCHAGWRSCDSHIRVYICVCLKTGKIQRHSNMNKWTPRHSSCHKKDRRNSRNCQTPNTQTDSVINEKQTNTLTLGQIWGELVVSCCIHPYNVLLHIPVCICMLIRVALDFWLLLCEVMHAYVDVCVTGLLWTCETLVIQRHSIMDKWRPRHSSYHKRDWRNSRNFQKSNT